MQLYNAKNGRLSYMLDVGRKGLRKWACTCLSFRTTTSPDLTKNILVSCGSPSSHSSVIGLMLQHGAICAIRSHDSNLSIMFCPLISIQGFLYMSTSPLFQSLAELKLSSQLIVPVLFICPCKHS